MPEMLFSNAIENSSMSPIVSLSQEARRRAPEYFNKTWKKIIMFRETLLYNVIASDYGACFGKYFAGNIRMSFSTTPVFSIEEGVERFNSVFK